MSISVAAMLAGIAIRTTVDRVGLWLDEAQSLAIASLPPGEIVEALAADGHPPLYYFLLHYWTGLFGSGDASLRYLSALFGGLAVTAVLAIGRRVGGWPLGLAAGALAATSPFLVRYSTEARMYSLVTLLVCLWWLSIDSATDKRNGFWHLAPITLAVGALLYTHYWSLFVFAGWFGNEIVRRRLFTPLGRKLVLAHLVGAVSFLPWLPTLLNQLRHTGTPWADAPNPVTLVVSGFADLAGGTIHTPGTALLAIYSVLLVVGVFGATQRAGTISLTNWPQAEARPIAGLVFWSLVVGVLVVVATNSAFASRYLSVVAGLLMVLLARGLVLRTPGGVAAASLAVVCLVGLGASWSAVTDERSQGQDVAIAIASGYQTGDLVVVCPDQLGPATGRYLPESAASVSFPLSEPIDRVDWTDYAQRNQEGDPAAFVDSLAPATGRVWLVWNSGYKTLDNKCETIHDLLWTRYSGGDLIGPDPDTFEPMWLSVFPAP